MTSMLLLGGALQALVPGADCPNQTLLEDVTICYGAGGIDNPENVAQATYTAASPIEAGAELCVKLDALAELEPGGYDRVFLRFEDDGGGTSTECVVGDSPGDCETLSGGGCATLPTELHQISAGYCYQPTPGAQEITVSVYVQPTDILYQCGDCPSGGSQEVLVESLEVVGCTGMAATGCGNGTVEAGEACDDGNVLASDGCDQSCNIEPGAICNTDGTACVGATGCSSLAASELPEPWCYDTPDDEASSPLSGTWVLGPGAAGGDVLLHWDVEGGVELHEPFFDILRLGWQDDAGGAGDFMLNDGDEITWGTETQAWSKGSLRITPSAGATQLVATVYVDTDEATSCAAPKADQSYEPLTLNALTLSACDVELTVYDTLAEFAEAIGSCYIVEDFNALADGSVGPFEGDGYSLDSDISQPGVPLTVSEPIHFYDKSWGSGYGYLSTQASGDGTAALEPQLQANFVSNSRLALDFVPNPAKAVALNLIDAGDWGGVMAVEAWRGDDLVFVDNDPQASGDVNNFIVWKGFVFSEPVDRVVFYMIDPSDHFAIDNLIVQPQADEDADGIPDICDCAPGDEKVAGSFPEICDDGIDNDCDGLVDGEDQDCGGGGTATCGDYADVDFAGDNGGWLTSGDQSWAWVEDESLWRAVAADGLSATLETGPIQIPASACPGFEATVDFGGSTADGDQITVTYAVNGGAFAPLDVLSGGLSVQTWPIAAAPGDTVSFRFTFETDAATLAGEDPTISSLQLTSDSGDSDADNVCDACDCAPDNPDYAFDCDQDDDGYCAAGAGQLNPDPAVANCDEDAVEGDGVGTDCNDDAAGANPGQSAEATNQCSDGLDNDCDGATDTEDSDCPLDDCVDEDGDGYGVGTTCLGPDCDDQAAECVADCTDTDGDSVADCADTCTDKDGDGFGEGPGCDGPDCNDEIDGCTTDCTTDADGNGEPDCGQAEVCVDEDGDGYGVGPDCLGPDCDDQAAECVEDCTDTDGDSIADCADVCTDKDGDGFGEGPGCPGDGGGGDQPDCDDDEAACTSDCSDSDADGVPDCADGCVDKDGDGFGEGAECEGKDCDDEVPECTDDCSDADGNGIPDCAPGGTGGGDEGPSDDTGEGAEIGAPGVGTDLDPGQDGCECRSGGSRPAPIAGLVMVLGWLLWRRSRRSAQS